MTDGIPLSLLTSHFLLLVTSYFLVLSFFAVSLAAAVAPFL